MSGGVNKAILVGRVGNLGEVKQAGQSENSRVLNFSLATNEKWTDKQGNKKEAVEWHRVTVWGKLADLCATYLSKGSQVYVEGQIRSRSFESKGQKQNVTEIVAQEVRFLHTDRQQPAPAEKDDDFGF